MNNVQLPEWYDRDKLNHECGFESSSEKKARLDHAKIKNAYADTKYRALRFGIELTMDECGLDKNNDDHRELFNG